MPTHSVLWLIAFFLLLMGCSSGRRPLTLGSTTSTNDQAQEEQSPCTANCTINAVQYPPTIYSAPQTQTPAQNFIQTQYQSFSSMVPSSVLPLPTKLSLPNIILKLGAKALDTAVGDLNRDGIPDLVIATGANALAVNGATGQPMYTIADPITCVAVGDVNADGNQEIVAGNTNSDGYGIKVYNGQSGIMMAKVHDIAFDIAIGDINKDLVPDGRPEIHTAQGVRARLYSFPVDQFVFVADFSEPTMGVRLADFNGDGSMDIINRNDTTWSVGMGVRVYDGPTKALLREYHDTVYDMDVGDIDRDGKTEIVVAEGHQIRIFHPPAGGESVLDLQIPAYHLALGKLNTDGVIDILVGNNQLTWALDGVSLLPMFSIPGFFKSLSIVNLDNDPYGDIIAIDR